MADEAASRPQPADLALPRVYARAMLDLATEKQQADELLAELDAVAQAVATAPGLADFLSSPLVGDRQRAEVLEKVFRGRASDLLVDALEVINRKGRLGLLPAIVEAYRSERREAAGMVDAWVTTAVPLSAAQRAALVAAIAAWSGKQPDLVEHVDPSILGGLVVEVAGQKVDSSLASRLRDVGSLLAARAAQEVHRGVSGAEQTAHHG